MAETLPDPSAARRTMIDHQLRTFDVTDLRVLEAVDAVPREVFVPSDRQALAYSDQSFVLRQAGGTRAMLMPMVLARMIQAADIMPSDRILDVGGGSGYGAAIMAGLGAEVVLLEEDAPIAELARTCLTSAGTSGVTIVQQPLFQGYPARAPYDVILINGAIEVDPTRLLEQLADGGRLLAIKGVGRAGRVVRYQKTGHVWGARNVFDASAPVLSAFREHESFRF
jgi:protein-L-isoaspartate(D-aspartate) O-methyltransferase